MCPPKDMTMVKSRKKIRLPRSEYGDPQGVYFITICAQRSGVPFGTDLSREIVDCLLELKLQKGFSLYCYCLMRDHLHLAISPPPDGPDVMEIVQHLKDATTRKTWCGARRARLWQRSFYDHIARRKEDVAAICEYIINNPVRAGLVQSHEQYPFCGLVDPV